MKTKQASVPIFVLIMAVMTGCPEPPVVSRTVSLSFPVSEQANKMSLSVSDNEVQEALKLIDTVLVSAGFVRDQSPENASVQGLVASYSKPGKEGLKRMEELPGVYLKGNKLDVVFAQGRNPNARVTSSTQRLLNSLQKELSSHFGAQRVQVSNSQS